MTTQEDMDQYFLDIAKAVSEQSTCLFIHAGSVLVDKDNNIIATGVYKGVNDIVNCTRDGICSYKERTGSYPKRDMQCQCDALYSQLFAIMSAPKDKLKDATLYIYAFDLKKQKPKTTVIDPVTSKLIQLVGIKRICSMKDEEYDFFVRYKDEL